MKAVVTGSTGMIASALIRLLLVEDFEVMAVARPDSTKIGNILESGNVRVFECDLANLSSLTDKLGKCDMFFHFGWAGTMGDGRNNTELQLKNVQYTLDAVKLAKSCGCKVFVGAGSQAEYGLANEKLSPKTPANPITAYGIAKYSAGKLSGLLARHLGVKHCWGRILSTYGPGDNNSMVMECIKAIINDEPFDTTKGEQIWDYLYCDDCAKAFYLMAIKEKDGAVYTVGSGNVLPLKVYIEAIRDEINPDFEIGFGNVEYFENQVLYLCADISDLVKDTGFKAETSFRDGIRRIVDWIR